MRCFPLYLPLLALSLVTPSAFALTETSKLPLTAEPSVTALDGDTLVVGLPYAAVDGQQQAGQIYLYQRDVDDWIGPVELMPSDRAAFDEVGHAVAVSGDTVVLGAPRHADDRGAVYVFVRTGGVWAQQAKLSAGDGVAGDRFGAAVGVTADTAVIGAPGAEASYVFQRTGTAWTQSARLQASNGNAGDGFGCAVAAAGASALVGAPRHGANQSGAGYVFSTAGSDWRSPIQSVLPVSAPAAAGLGYAVDLSGRVALLGAPGEADATGAAYVLFNTGANWVQQARLVLPDGAPGERLGSAVSLGGERADVALLGAPGAGPDPEEGALHLFARQGTAWQPLPENPLIIDASNTGDALGQSVGLFGDTVVATAPGADAGYVYRFDCGFGRDWTAGVWLFGALPCAPDPATVQAQLGDDLPGAYGRRWVLYDWLEATNTWLQLSLGSLLAQGVGFEHKSLDGARSDLSGMATPLIVSDQCPSSAGCFEIPLTPPSGGEGYKANLVGHPFPYPVDWADVRFVHNGTAYVPSDAHAANLAYKQFKRYNGSAYESYDDSTPGLNGNLWPHESVWVYTRPGAAGGIKLLIPALPSRQTTAFLPELLHQALAWLVPSALATPREDMAARATAKDRAKVRDARRKQHREAIRRHQEWFVQLIVETDDGRFGDPANVLGQLSNAANRYDAYDLIELDSESDLPPDGPRLFLVFPHGDWRREAGDYNSDYHRLSGNQADAWEFEVRGNQTGPLRLRWLVSSPEALERARLVDLETGAVVEPADLDHYVFEMDHGSRSFRWEYRAKKDKPKKTRPGES